LRDARIPEYAASALPGRKPPAWTFLHGLKSPLSSTALRALRRHTRSSTSAPARRKRSNKAANKAGRKAGKKRGK